MQARDKTVKVGMLEWTEVGMDLSPFTWNLKKIQNRRKYHHSLKEHPMFSKIAKFGGEML